jgi:hypothetical protein
MNIDLTTGSRTAQNGTRHAQYTIGRSVGCDTSLLDEPANDVDGDPNDDGSEDVTEQRVTRDRTTNRSVRDAGIRYLVGHPDREREIHEVEIVGLPTEGGGWASSGSRHQAASQHDLAETPSHHLHAATVTGSWKSCGSTPDCAFRRNSLPPRSYAVGRP